MSESMFHSVKLDPEKCVGCTTCIKKCPTEAIRVRKGRASIMETRCIDCGECIRTCPHGAKKAVSDPLSMLSSYRYRVAIPAPALYSQFDEGSSVDRLLSGLLELGFDEVFEVAEAAELVTFATRDLLAAPMPATPESQEIPGPSGIPESRGPDRPRKPLLSSACPAVVKLVQVRFPSLIPHLVPLMPPMEVAARIVRERLHPGMEGLGVFFISPCAGKVTASRSPLGYARSALDGVIGLKDIYLPLRAAAATAPERHLAKAGRLGLGWARSEGESDAVGERQAISVDGIANVIGVLEALENGKLEDLAYIEALACPAGCVGGPLTVENPFIARARLRNREDQAGYQASEPRGYEVLDDIGWTRTVAARSSLALDSDRLKALVMLEEIDVLATSLPGLDCGSCGAPSCASLAEDIVRGSAVTTDCIFKLRENIRKLARELLDLEAIQPPGLDRQGDADSAKLEVPGSSG